MKREFRELSNSGRDSSGTQADRLVRRHQVRVPAGPPLIIKFLALWH
jgi:hypothetical protein